MVSTVGQSIEQRKIMLPADEKLVTQLISRRRLYDSRGRERLESKADLRARGVESPDRADALIGAIIMAQDRQVDWNDCAIAPSSRNPCCIPLHIFETDGNESTRRAGWHQNPAASPRKDALGLGGWARL